MLEPSQGNVLAQKHVERGVDVLEHIIPDKHDGVESFQDHAYFRRGVPPVTTPCREKGRFETMATTAAHRVEQLCPIVAEERVLLAMATREDGRGIEIRRFDAAVLVAFEVAEVAVEQY